MTPPIADRELPRVFQILRELEEKAIEELKAEDAGKNKK